MEQNHCFVLSKWSHRLLLAVCGWCMMSPMLACGFDGSAVRSLPVLETSVAAGLRLVLCKASVASWVQDWVGGVAVTSSMPAFLCATSARLGLLIVSCPILCTVSWKLSMLACTSLSWRQQGPTITELPNSVLFKGRSNKGIYLRVLCRSCNAYNCMNMDYS